MLTLETLYGHLFLAQPVKINTECFEHSCGAQRHTRGDPETKQKLTKTSTCYLFTSSLVLFDPFNAFFFVAFVIGLVH